MSAPPLRIGFIGDGGIARSLRATLHACEGFRFEVAAILSRSPCDLASGLLTLNVAELLAARPDVVVECAGHGAVVAFGETILRAGIPLLIVSIGSLADDALLARLRAAADEGQTRMILSAGAMAGIDALAAARLGGLTRVRYIGRKPALAWIGTPAEAAIDLHGLAQATVFFCGTARDAARRYPKNSNVAATIALAGLGFELTEVELVADPHSTKNVHQLLFEGADGQFEISISGEPSPTNPKTSALTAHSLARILTGMASSLVI